MATVDVKAFARYVEMVERRCQVDNIVQRVEKLVKQCQQTGVCSKHDERILNAIDANITEIMLWAETKCKGAKGHDWSPLLANAGQTVIAAKWNLSNIVHGCSPIPINITREEAISKAKVQISEAYNILRKAQKHAKRIRETFLEDRAEHLAETRDMTKAAAVRQLLLAERSSAIYKRLGFWFKGKEYTTLDQMLVPDDPSDLEHSTWTTIIKA
jgi:hypothetical protein